ncbi:hypothetical protein HAX54_039425 [Datura stramonium]|uniref:Uncharacterized protein n=1 Tax=Datura stramonium TaxID=4076 RepID=A0ABS8SJ17_DATST|nr:hypothetical protein [Datura stramonium]
MTAEVTERNVGLIQYRILDLHRRLMVGDAFFEKKDSGKRMLIKNRRLMPTPSTVATTLLHPDKVTRTGGIISMRLYRLLIKGRQHTTLVPTIRFGLPGSNPADLKRPADNLDEMKLHHESRYG